jgi:hypothetical protein
MEDLVATSLYLQGMSSHFFYIVTKLLDIHTFLNTEFSELIYLDDLMMARICCSQDMS